MAFNFIKKSQLYFIFSFVAVIMFGAVLLKMPFVTHSGGELAWIDALFTATSAVCVTGLITVTTSGFNLAGQLIILCLIQIGAIGIMTLTASIILLIGRNMSMSNTLMFSTYSENFPLRRVEGLLKTIISYTFAIEACGVVLLTYGFMENSDLNLLDAAYLAVFHSISAFCNAGFSTFDKSLIGAGPFVKIVVSGLIILGGLGVYVIYDLTHFPNERKAMLRIHSKLVIITSVALIIFGMFAIKGLEYFNGNVGLSWLDAYFQSVTCRTAGFNTIDLGALHSSCIIVMIALMLIGASPGSTGGGMKTTTAALVFISIYNTFKGNQKVLLFGRNIPLSNVLKAFSIMFIFILLAITGAVLIAAASGATLQGAFFEISSALGTVGLSLGLTAKAGSIGKFVLIFAMFIGRIGPFTIFLFLLSKEKQSRLEFPEERIIMG